MRMVTHACIHLQQLAQAHIVIPKADAGSTCKIQRAERNMAKQM